MTTYDERTRICLTKSRFESLSESEKEMWRSGDVAHILHHVGVPVITHATIPIICFRINLLSQVEAQLTIASGVPLREVTMPGTVTPNQLSAYKGGVISGGDYKTVSDEAFMKLVAERSYDKLPALDVLDITTAQLTLLNLADGESETVLPEAPDE